MKNLLVSAATVALIASSPALAAPHDHGGHGGPHSDANPIVTPAHPTGPAGGHGGTSGGHHDRSGANPFGGAHSNPITPTPPTAVTPRGHNGHNGRDNNGHGNSTTNPFGTHGGTQTHNRSNAHNNAFNAFRRAFTAPRHYHYRGGSYHRPAGWRYQRWTLGAFLPTLYWTSSYWINDYNYYGLDNPPPGTVWVRYGDDALLIDRDSGEVIQVIYGIFY